MNRRTAMKILGASVMIGPSLLGATPTRRLLIPSIDDENVFCRSTRPNSKYHYVAKQDLILVMRFLRLGEIMVTAMPLSQVPTQLQIILLGRHNKQRLWDYCRVGTRRIRAGRYFGRWNSWATVPCEIEIVDRHIYKTFTMGKTLGWVYWGLRNSDISKGEEKK